MEARPVTVLATEEFVAAAALEPGQVVELPDGRAGVVSGVEDIANGERYAAITKGDLELDCASGTTLSAGAAVEWDDTNNVVVAAAGGDFRVGVLKEAKTSGQLFVRVSLNEEPLD